MKHIRSVYVISMCKYMEIKEFFCVITCHAGCLRSQYKVKLFCVILLGYICTYVAM